MISTFHPVAERTHSRKAREFRAFVLHRPMKAPERFNRIVDGVGGKKAGAEYAVAQARDLAIFMNLEQAPSGKAGDFQTHGVRSDIDRG